MFGSLTQNPSPCQEQIFRFDVACRGARLVSVDIYVLVAQLTMDDASSMYMLKAFEQLEHVPYDLLLWQRLVMLPAHHKVSKGSA
jgi:hypothetical protein